MDLLMLSLGQEENPRTSSCSEPIRCGSDYPRIAPTNTARPQNRISHTTFNNFFTFDRIWTCIFLNYGGLFCETNRLYHKQQKAASKKASVRLKHQHVFIFIAFKAVKYLYYQVKNLYYQVKKCIYTYVSHHNKQLFYHY